MSKKSKNNLDKLFGSRSRVKLLGLFFSNPEKSFYVREITRLIDEQINSVRRELSNMQELGVVRSDTYDNKLYYTINTKCSSYEALRLLFASDITSDDKEKTKAVSASDVWDIAIKPIKNIVELFMVMEGAPGKSDIDMLIVGTDTDKKISKWAGIIEKKQGRPLNYVILTHEDYFYRLSVKDKFLMKVLAQDFTVIIDNKGLAKAGGISV
jgi:hypothetical protein